MNDKETGLMENEILSEEPASLQKPEAEGNKQASKISLPKISFSFKKPKVITLIILFFTIFVLYLGLTVFSTRKGQENLPVTENYSLASPLPSKDERPADLVNGLSSYKDKINARQDFSSKLQLPVIDLDINF